LTRFEGGKERKRGRKFKFLDPRRRREGGGEETLILLGIECLSGGGGTPTIFFAKRREKGESGGTSEKLVDYDVVVRGKKTTESRFRAGKRHS